MSAKPPGTSEPAPGDPIGVRYPNTARIWNYQLGGKDNFAVDREASDAANAMVSGLGVPAGTDTAVESRHLLQRMVDYMLRQGVRQFLDLGSGLPNMANTHQIVHRVAPEARVVYVDIDPLVSTHAAALMAGELASDHAAYLRGRVGRDPTSGELYAAHFLGPQGSARLIEANRASPGASAASMFPEAAAANRPIFYREGRAATVSEVYASLTRGATQPASAGATALLPATTLSSFVRLFSHRVAL